MKVKIMRAWLPSIDDYVYLAGGVGDIEVAKSTWEAYKEALDCVNNFEQEIDRQYEEKNDT